MDKLQVDKIYIHKNMIKKIKRDHYLKDQLILFHHTFHDWLLEGTSFLEQIEDGVYAKKLLYHKLIVFDRPMDLESIVFWDFLTNDHSVETKDTIDEEFHQQETLDVIEGNQFIFFTISENEFEKKLEELVQSNQLELQFVLDSKQNEALSSFYEDMINVAITGAAGAGKTLMLNRIAHSALEREQSFLYVTFSETLKERFNYFLKADMEKVNNTSFITTYEDLIRNFIAPQVNINAEQYLRFIDCQSFLENSWARLQKESKIHTYLSKKDVCRILMTLPTNNVGDQKETKNKTVSSIIKAKLEKLKSTDSLAFNHEDSEFIEVAATQFSQYAKKLKKKHWSDLLHDIAVKLEADKTYMDYSYILIDEMQDLGQFEYTFLVNLIGKSRETKLIATFDANQRISYEGSTERNFENRLQHFEKKIYLPHSYRNAANIYQLAEKFKNVQEEDYNTKQVTKTNINLNKVKFLLSDDTDELINQLTSRFIPEENLNIGILAFGQTYEKYYHHFLHEDGRKKFIGIEYYNEEQIKGLEFTNLIIIDFLELYRVSQNISPIEMRKWYVAITRACDNIMIQIQDHAELLEFNKKTNLSLIEEDYGQQFQDIDEAMKQFNQDILVSLGDEQKTLLAQEAQQLLYMYREKKEYDYLEDAVDIFYKIGMLESLRNLLEILFDEESIDRKSIAYELVKVCIEVNDPALIKKYMPYVHFNQYYKIEEKVKKENEQLLPVVQELFSEKPKSRRTILNEVRKKTFPLKDAGDNDQYITVCSENELYGDIVNFYKMNPNIQLTKRSYKRLGRALQKEGKVKEAITFYLDHQMYEEALRFYEGIGNYQEAFAKCLEVLQKGFSQTLEEKAYQLAMKLYDEQYFKQLLECSDNVHFSKTIRVLYELYKMTKDESYLQRGIEKAYQQQDYMAIIRFYQKNHDIQYHKHYQKYLIEAFESMQRYEELANLYNDLEDDESAYTAFHQAYIVKPTESLTEELMMMTRYFIQKNVTVNVMELLQKHAQQTLTICEKHDPPLAVHLLMKLEKLEEAVKTATRFELFDEVIQIAEKYPTIRTNCSVDVAKAYEQVKSFKESAAVHKEANRFVMSAMMLLKANMPLNELLRPLLFPVVEKVRQQPALLDEILNEFILDTFTADFELQNIREEFRVKKARGWLNIWLEKLITTSEPEEVFHYQYLSQNKDHIQQVLNTLYQSKNYDELIQYYGKHEKVISTIDDLGIVIQSYQAINDTSVEHYDIHLKRITAISKLIQIEKEKDNQLLDRLSESVNYVVSSEYFAVAPQMKQLFKVLKPIESYLSSENIQLLIEIALVNQVVLIAKKEKSYPFVEFVDRLINDSEFKGSIKFLNKEAIEPTNKRYSELFRYLQFTIHTHLYSLAYALFVETRNKQMEVAKHENDLKEFTIQHQRMKDYHSAFNLIVDSIEKTMKENNIDELLELELEIEDGRKSTKTKRNEFEIIHKKEQYFNQIVQFIQEGKDLKPLLNDAKRERKRFTLSPDDVKKQRDKLNNSYQEAKRQFEREKELFNQKLTKIYDFVQMYPYFLMPNMEENKSQINHPITYMFLRDELVVKTSTGVSKLPIIFSLHSINRLELAKNNGETLKILEQLVPINNTLVVEKIEKEKSYEYLKDNTWEKIEEIEPILIQQRIEYELSVERLRKQQINLKTKTPKVDTKIEPENHSTSEPEIKEQKVIVQEQEVEKVGQQNELKEIAELKIVDELNVAGKKVEEEIKPVKIPIETNIKLSEVSPVLEKQKVTRDTYEEISNGIDQQNIKGPNVTLMFKLLDQNVQALAEVCGIDEEFVAFCIAKENEPAYATRKLIEKSDTHLIPMVAQATGISEHVLFQYKKYIKSKKQLVSES
ncbi:AAA family ATPase [Bacillus sp. X1(2014)]|uniref:AAA family ATPase n=1 Tax=Bacillus sp. X1(2014) TaxID=1565991 RepID=UPI0011A23E14|nr:AAA family ATPase [Bacillus sp. X1(2014)]